MKRPFIILTSVFLSCNTNSVDENQGKKSRKVGKEILRSDSVIEKITDTTYTVEYINSNHTMWNKKNVAIQGVLSIGYEHISLDHDSIPENSDPMKYSIWLSDFDSVKVVDKWGNKTALANLVNKKISVFGLFEHVGDKLDTNDIFQPFLGFGHLNIWKSQLSRIKKIKEIN